MPTEKKCVVYYKIGFLEGRYFGERFDGFEPCCGMFEEVFLRTGNEKNGSWDKNTLLNRVESGINFIKQESRLMILMCGKPIQFCPWSGHAIEVQNLRQVALKRKFKTIPDGYQEVDPGEGEANDRTK